MVHEGAVGIDPLNIDDTTDTTRPVHTALLGADIAICEHLTSLSAVPATGYRFTTVVLNPYPDRALTALLIDRSRRCATGGRRARVSYEHSPLGGSLVALGSARRQQHPRP